MALESSVQEEDGYDVDQDIQTFNEETVALAQTAECSNWICYHRAGSREAGICKGPATFFIIDGESKRGNIYARPLNRCL